MPLSSFSPAMRCLLPHPVLQLRVTLGCTDTRSPGGWSSGRERILNSAFTLQTATGGSAGRRKLSFLGRLSSMHVASGEAVQLLM